MFILVATALKRPERLGCQSERHCTRRILNGKARLGGRRIYLLMGFSPAVQSQYPGLPPYAMNSQRSSWP